MLRERDHATGEQHARRNVVEHRERIGIPRTGAFVLLEVVSRPRGADAKVMFYERLRAAPEAACGIAGSDVIVSITENSDAY